MLWKLPYLIFTLVTITMVTDVSHGYLKNWKGGYLFIQTVFDKLGFAVTVYMYRTI